MSKITLLKRRLCVHCLHPLYMRRGGQEYTRCQGCWRWLHRDTTSHVRVFGSCYQAHGAQCLSQEDPTHA
jgi:hypothetical protein